MILNENSNIVVEGYTGFSSKVSFTIFYNDDDNNSKFYFMNLNNNDGNYVEHSIYKSELGTILEAITNNDFKTLKNSNNKIGEALQSFYNFTFINEDIINKTVKILDIVLSDHEIELYNQDFNNTRKNLYTFSKETFLNNWFYCLGNVPVFENLSDEQIIKEIVRYYVKVFVGCAIECQSDVDDFY